MDEVFMIPAEVRNIAKMFKTISDVLKNVSKALKVLITMLRTAAMIGAIGAAAIAQFLDMIKPQVDRCAAKCAELNADLTASVAAFERGDAQGATRFY